MTNFNKKKCIIFDLGNVVLDIDLNITYQRFEALGFSYSADYINKYKQSGIFGDIEEGRISSDEFCERMKQQLHPNVSNNDIKDAWNALFLGYKPERIETILKLKEKFKVYLLSNTNAIHIDFCAYNVPIVGSLEKLFDKVFYSYKMGMRKPDKNIFEAVLNDIPFSAEESLFLDDSPANVEAAEKLGIESWLIEDPNGWTKKFNHEISRI
ncbi:HAD family phosphatase [Labilibacter sediminis]|nr:HAD family phosphatase [Labilibacter sediminis]